MSFGHLAHAKPSLEVGIVTGPNSDVATFTSNAAITAGQVVMLDITMTTVSDREKYVIASTGALGSAAIGVALEAATGADELIRVCDNFGAGIHLGARPFFLRILCQLQLPRMALRLSTN